MKLWRSAIDSAPVQISAKLLCGQVPSLARQL
jgi:hypothetical protein